MISIAKNWEFYNLLFTLDSQTITGKSFSTTYRSHMKIAYRKKYSFCSNPDEYRIFLKENLFNLKPTYYTLIKSLDMMTVDGPMIIVNLISKDLDDPNSIIVARCTINNEIIYFWDNHCWGVAIDKNSQLIQSNNKHDKISTLLYKIGEEINVSDS